MIKTGLIIKIEDEYAIIMSKDSSFERVIKKDNMAIGSKIMYTETDVIQKQKRKRVYFMKKKLLLSIPAIAIALLLIVLNPGDIINIDNTKVTSAATTATIVTVDINPSFKIFADETNIVLNVEAMNEDAKTIQIEDLIGLKTVDAIEAIIERSELAGFIDTTDLEDDFVLVTSIDADDEDDIDNTQYLMDQLQIRAQDSQILEKVNVAMTQANMEQLQNAEQNKTSAGLMNINNGEETSVKEYFANKENVQAFTKNGDLIEANYEHKLQVMEKIIGELDNEETLKNSLSLEFKSTQDAYNESNQKYQEAMSKFNNAADSESQALLEEADLLKLQVEENQRNVEAVKLILKNAVNNVGTDQQLMEQIATQTKVRMNQKNDNQSENNEDQPQVNKPDDTQQNKAEDNQVSKADEKSSDQGKSGN
jgi:hypothetical protein